MKIPRRGFLLSCCALLAPSQARAQSGGIGATSDSYHIRGKIFVAETFGQEVIADIGKADGRPICSVVTEAGELQDYLLQHRGQEIVVTFREYRKVTP